MKYALLLVTLVIVPAAHAQKTITIDDVFQYYKFYPQSAGGYDYRKDGHHYIKADKKGLHLYDVRTPDRDSILTMNLPESASVYDRYTFTDDETKVLLRAEAEPVYRHSVRARYYIYDFATGTTLPVYEAEKQQYAALSPDGTKIAYVAGNNVFYRDLKSGAVTQITRDGRANEIINGLADWVYEEEFSPVDGEGMVALRWSPDGTKIAFLRFDEREVPEFPLTWYANGMYPGRTTFKYPKVGEANSTVTAHVYDLTGGTTWTADAGPNADTYLPRIYWMPDNRLVLGRLNRHQDTLDLLQYTIPDPMAAVGTTLAPTLLLRETDPAYVDIESEKKLMFLEKSPRFVFISEESGFRHLYLYDNSGKRLGALTKGDFDVTEVYGVDEKNGKFYYQTATPTPMDRQVWEGALDGKTAPRLLTPGRGTHEAEFSPTFDFYLLSRSELNTPPTAALYNRAGGLIRTIEENKRTARLRQEYGFANKQFITVPAADGTPLNAWMLRPANFDSTRRYPVLFDIYGGPGSQTVQNQYDGYVGAWHQLLAQKGYIIVSVDNRGTGGRGRAFKKMTQLQLGKYETEDQIAAARHLASLPYVDRSRIGIWGWSFGGYLSTSCVLKGSDVFKMAMAVAPVTNWKWYDSAYTERYMHTLKDNTAGYEQNSPVNFAEKLRGDNYLLCHGVADDNVHWQQSVEMVNALIRANKQFETYYYPNRNHGIHGENATRHLFTKLTNFVLEKL